LNSKVLFDEDGWTRFNAEVPKMKVITPSALVERLKINVSLARAACKYLTEEGKITPVEIHNKQQIYTKVAAAPA
jgi:small subunit ribosomal protein S25e